jgi:DNA adenine methylase
VLDRKGCALILSNSDTPELKALYKGFHIRQIQAPRAVGASAESRGSVGELVITNYETGEA